MEDSNHNTCVTIIVTTSNVVIELMEVPQNIQLCYKHWSIHICTFKKSHLLLNNELKMHGGSQLTRAFNNHWFTHTYI